MLRLRTAHRLAPLLSVLAAPIGASAQTAGRAPANPTPSGANWGEGVAIVTVILILLIGIGFAVRLYDIHRRRVEETAALQSLLSDALLLDRSVTGLPVAAFVSRSLWPRSPVVIAVRGSVPTPELRNVVMRIVEGEVSRRQPGAQVEDRLMVDPLIGKRVA